MIDVLEFLESELEFTINDITCCYPDT